MVVVSAMVEVEVGPIVVVDVGPSLEVVETAVLVDDSKVEEVVAGPVVVVPLNTRTRCVTYRAMHTLAQHVVSDQKSFLVHLGSPIKSSCQHKCDNQKCH